MSRDVGASAAAAPGGSWNAGGTWIAVLLFAALLPALGWLPYTIDPPENVASAAALAGYHNGAAHAIAAALCLAGLALAAWLEARRREAGAPAAGADTSPAAVGRIRAVELAVVFGCVVLAYWPWFLARYGPYIEDSYFLTALHRMHAGQVPYRDFESLYGPLMLYGPHAWTGVFGYSMVAYYGLVALLEASLFGALLMFLQRALPDRRARWIAFALAGSFFVDTLLGMSTNGWRRFVPLLAVLCVAARPLAWRTVAVAGALCGGLLAYSHDYGVIALAAMGSVYGLTLVWERRLRAALPGLALLGVALMVWLGISFLLLGQVVPTYFENAVYGASRFAAEASFPFYWTVHSAATFAFLALGVVIAGRGLGRGRDVSLASGDRLFVAAVVWALIGLKSGLNRADMWHLAPPLQALVFAFLLPWPRRRVVVSRGERRAALALMGIMAVTYLAALAPSGSYLAQGWMGGARDGWSGESPPASPAVTRAPSLEIERTHPSPHILALGGFLAEPARHHRRVLLFGRLWGLDKQIGVTKSTYPTDDFLLSDDSGVALVNELRADPEMLVVIERDVWDALQAPGETEVALVYPPSATKRILAWLSTIHFSAAEVENRQKNLRWRRTVGVFLAAHCAETATFGDLVVLERADARGRAERGGGG